MATPFTTPVTDWVQHGVTAAVICSVVVGVGKWIVKHLEEVKAKLNGYTVTVQRSRDKK
jgi:hypothetical protein